MADILLNKSDFLIKNNNTPKKIPFMYNGTGYPRLVHVSESELPSNWKFTEETDNEGEYDIENAAYDDWGNQLGKSDFSGDYILVSGVEQSEIIDSASAPDESHIGNWDTAEVSESDTDLIVSNYNGFDELSNAEKVVFHPEKYNWENVNVIKQANETLRVNHPTSIHTISNSHVIIEPCERRWTNEVTLSINYDYAYLKDSTYDIDVCIGNTGATWLYKILDSEKSNNDRIWYNIANQRAIYYNDTENTWKLVRYNNIDLENKTITLETNSVYSYQYVTPTDLEWLFGVEPSEEKAHTYPDGTTRLSFVFPKAGSIVNKHTFVETKTPVGNWESGSISLSTEEDSTDLLVRGTTYRELSKNLVSYSGSWSNGINMLESGSGASHILTASGFNEDDVNGVYVLFDVDATGTNRVWMRLGEKSIYTISYNGYWRLCTSVDGTYTLVDENAEDIYKVWACNNGNITNYIFFSRYDNKWCLKSCESLHLDFYPLDNSANPLVGFETSWRSEIVNESDKEYYLKYDKKTLVWIFYDSYDNIVSVQKVLPTFWTNNAVVSWADNQVITDDPLSSGTYTEEPFDTDVAAFSYKKESSLKSCYLVYDFNVFAWKIIEKLNLNGDYSLVENNNITQKVWQLGGDNVSYRISWNSEMERWELSSYLGTLYDFTTDAANILPEPVEATWSSTVSAMFDSYGDIILSFSEENDADGLYELEDNTATGTDRIWNYSGANGDYTIAYDLSNYRWSLRYFDTFVNGTYTLDDEDASGSLKTWSRMANSCEYKIAWNNHSLQWNILKNTTKIMASSNAVTFASEKTWASGANVFTNASGMLFVSGNTDNPDVNGAYLDDDSSKTGLRKTYSKTDTVSVYTIFYDTASLKWSIRYRNLDFNGEYEIQVPNTTGNNRVFSREGEKGSYFIRHNAIQGYWELLGNDNEVISYQELSDSEPYGGIWSVGSVSDPFSGTNFCSALITFTLKSKQQYNYNLTGNNNSEYGKCNGTYIIQDYTKTGGSRVWKNSSGMYIKFLETRWAIVDDPNITTMSDYWTDYGNHIYAYSDLEMENAKDLSKITWNVNGSYFYGSFQMTSSEVEEYGSKTLWMAIGDYEESTIGSKIVRTYVTSNIVRFTMTVKPDEITNVSMNLIGSTGSKDFTGFYKNEDGRFTPTDLVHVAYSAASPTPIRIKFTGGFSIPGVDFTVPYTSAGIESKTGILTETELGGTDSVFNVVMTVQDQAGNAHSVSQKITHISRLWRMTGTNIKQDDASYQTRLFSVLSAAQSLEIPKSSTSSEDYTRKWEDIFYPETHGYPRNADGIINEAEAIRISKPVDETGVNGPTTEELARYDQLQLSNDGTALSVDADNRTMTSGWQKNKTYNRMESSSYGENGDNLKYWVIDNTGYSDLKLEFEYFDLSNQISNIPPNILSPYDGDVLVVYDAQAEGCLEEIIDIYGNKTYRINDSSLLVELFAFTGSCYTEDIKMKSGTALPITQTGNGFTTSAITSTSKICLILYTDNDYQGSGFKIKAGPRHNIVYYNYDMNNSTGEVWIHQEPGTTRNNWYSPSRVSSTHQYMTANVTFDYENGVLTLDSRSGSTITGDFTVYEYLNTAGETLSPSTYFSYQDTVSGNEYHPSLKKFLLYNDDCVDYYEIALCVQPSGIIPDYNSIYSFQNGARNSGKIVSDYVSNKDKGTITFTNAVPLGRIFGNYTYHSYYRLTNDGYGDLYFYDNSLVPSSDYSTTGLRDWTYVDLMIYNEGSNSLSEGIMKFMSRGYIEGSGSSQTVTQVVDENRPWDVQSGTIEETINRTGASFSVSYAGLTEKTRGAAVRAIGETSSGGLSFGATMLPRAKGYIRLYWCLATNDSNNPSYVVTTRGKKLWSSELSGKYFVVTV